MGHSENHTETPVNHWEKELQRSSLKEPALINKYYWIKPLTVYHSLEFKGLDKRDYYEPQNYDAWDHQAWNTQKVGRFNKKCADYFLDMRKCHQYLKTEFGWMKESFVKRKDYCWKMTDNFANCKRVHFRNNLRFVKDGAVFPEDH